MYMAVYMRNKFALSFHLIDELSWESMRIKEQFLISKKASTQIRKIRCLFEPLTNKAVTVKLQIYIFQRITYPLNFCLNGVVVKIKEKTVQLLKI